MKLSDEELGWMYVYDCWYIDIFKRTEGGYIDRACIKDSTSAMFVGDVAYFYNFVEYTKRK